MEMFKVKIFDGENTVSTEMPIIPEKGESIGYWINKEWVLRYVYKNIYQFDEENNFSLVQINVSE